MLCVYIAHPLSAEDRLGMASHRDNASLWVAWAARLGFCPMASWITLSNVLPETPDNRKLGLALDCAQLERCDALWLCGGRVSTGMEIERQHARAVGVPIVDLTPFGYGPPDPEYVDLPLPPPGHGGVDHAHGAWSMGFRRGQRVALRRVRALVESHLSTLEMTPLQAAREAGLGGKD